ncbi:MAG: GNAT family N-acetyltransferase [Rubripirellula sp.]
MSLIIERASLEHLQEVLPRLLSRLSIGRAQIALEQLRSNLHHRPHDEVLFYLAREPDAAELLDSGQAAGSGSIAALIAIQQPCNAPPAYSDVATIVHADFLVDISGEIPNSSENNSQGTESAPHRDRLMPPAEQHAVIMEMRTHVDQDLTERGIRFVQWATDATDQIGLSTHQWHQGLGFQQIATLDYLTGNADRTGTADPSSAATHNHLSDHPTQVAIELRTVGWDSAESRLAFTQLVESTYQGTLDCPELSRYRTPGETLRGYQTAASFAPDLWFEVLDAHSPDNTPIGCLILAKHAESPGNANHGNANHGNANPETAASGNRQSHETQSDTNTSHEGPVIEIAYMGLLPETRGKGFGRRLVDQAAQVAATLGGTRFILGVDQTNQPARDIYNAKGMTPLLSETVWVKRVEFEKP